MFKYFYLESTVHLYQYVQYVLVHLLQVLPTYYGNILIYYSKNIKELLMHSQIWPLLTHIYVNKSNRASLFKVGTKLLPIFPGNTKRLF